MSLQECSEWLWERASSWVDRQEDLEGEGRLEDTEDQWCAAAYWISRIMQELRMPLVAWRAGVAL